MVEFNSFSPYQTNKMHFSSGSQVKLIFSTVLHKQCAKLRLEFTLAWPSIGYPVLVNGQLISIFPFTYQIIYLITQSNKAHLYVNKLNMPCVTIPSWCNYKVKDNLIRNCKICVASSSHTTLWHYTYQVLFG